MAVVPESAGAINDTVTEPLPGTADTREGALGTRGVTDTIKAMESEQVSPPRDICT